MNSTPVEAAQDANYDESLIPPYTLPDALVTSSGSQVGTAEQWEMIRRPEIMSLFAEQMFGRVPEMDLKMEVISVEAEDEAWGGKVKRRQHTLRFTNEQEPDLKPVDVQVLMYLPPESDERVPVFVAYNFFGNHSIASDPEIMLSPAWMRNSKDKGVVENRASEKTRGVSESRWPVETIVERGYGLVTLYYGDVDPDFDDGFRNGIHALVPRKENDLAPDEWGSIATWAWGLSRVMDFLETQAEVDSEKVAVMGHSRLGKTSLWAGASDQRFSLVISNNSGCGGAALSRRRIGETVQRINTVFPHWFCDNFQKYNGKEDQLPIDQHLLISLIAPRPVYVASAVKDRWADPKGEFLSAAGADSVYKLLTGEGIASQEMPQVDQPYHSLIGYHVRSGGHDVKAFDWEQYLSFADRWMK